MGRDVPDGTTSLLVAGRTWPSRAERRALAKCLRTQRLEPAINGDAAASHLLEPREPSAGKAGDLPVLDHEALLDAGAARELGVVVQVVARPVYGDEAARPYQLEHVLQLVVRGVAAGV